MGSAQAAAGNGGGNDADTYGWDTVFALSFTHANAAVTAQWSTVDNAAKALSQAESGYTLTATLGPWQLTTGGDGKNVRLACPVASGSYVTPSQTYPLGNLGVQFVIEIGMEWVPDPGQFFFTISGNATVDAIKADLGNGQIDATLQASFASHGKPLSSAATVAGVITGKGWLITDGSAQYYVFLTTDKSNDEFLLVYQFETVWQVNLQAIESAIADNEPAVALINIINNPVSGVAADVLAQLASTWFNDNIGAFNLVFASVDLSPSIAKQTSYTWMLPTATSYAVTDQGSLDTSVFGVLTMVQNNTAGKNHQVSPYAIPTGSDAGFLISGTNFMKNMLLAGARLIFNNAPAASFTISNDGLTIVNNARILFGTFHMDDDPQATIADNGFSAQLDAGAISPALIQSLGQAGVAVTSAFKVTVTAAGSQWVLATGDAESAQYILNKDGANLQVFPATSIWVDAQNFQMSLNHTWVQIQFINVTYPANSDWDTHVNYSENVPLGLKSQNGKSIFWMGDPTSRSLVVAVTQTKAAITREIVEDAVFAAIALLAIAGPITEGLLSSSEVEEVSANGGRAVINESGFARAAADNPVATAADNEESGLLAARQSSGRCTRIKAAFKTPKWKVVGTLAALAGAARGVDELVDRLLEKAAKDKWEDVPGFDDFAQQAIQPYSFPGVTGFTLQSAALAGSLQIGLNVQAS